MSGRYKSVDLGPMALPQEEDGMIFSTVDLSDRQSDILKLSLLLRGDNSNRSKKYPGNENFNNINSLSILNVDMEIEIMSELAEKLCVFGKTSNSSEVKVRNLKIRENFLLNASLSASLLDGCLVMEIILENEKNIIWLSEKLAWITRQVGEKLQRRLKLSIKSTFDGDRIILTATWPEEVN